MMGIEWTVLKQLGAGALATVVFGSTAVALADLIVVLPMDLI